MLFELLKAALLGLVQGITEWLPVSSGGHLMLLNRLIPLNVSNEFWNLFEVVIQLGSILAVIVLYFERLNPFAHSKSYEKKRETWSLWLKIIIAVIPSGIVGVLFNDLIEEKLGSSVVVAVALIVYGVVFLFIDRLEGGRHAKRISRTAQISYKTAFLIGCFQVLALIPGTSRSGSTIIGALLLGLGRTAAVRFSFYMAIPTMLGASLLKCLKFVLDGGVMTNNEMLILAVGSLVAFVVSLLVIRELVHYVRTHTFKAFGVYRIILGLVVLAIVFI